MRRGRYRAEEDRFSRQRYRHEGLAMGERTRVWAKKAVFDQESRFRIGCLHRPVESSAVNRSGVVRQRAREFERRVPPALRRASAVIRQFVLWTALAGLLILPAVSALLPAWQVLPSWARFEAAPATPTAAANTNTEKQPAKNSVGLLAPERGPSTRPAQATMPLTTYPWPESAYSAALPSATTAPETAAAAALVGPMTASTAATISPGPPPADTGTEDRPLGHAHLGHRRRGLPVAAGVWADQHLAIETSGGAWTA